MVIKCDTITIYKLHLHLSPMAQANLQVRNSQGNIWQIHQTEWTLKLDRCEFIDINGKEQE